MSKVDLTANEMTPKMYVISALKTAIETDDKYERDELVKFARKKAAFLSEDTITECKVVVQCLLKEAADE